MWKVEFPLFLAGCIVVGGLQAKVPQRPLKEKVTLGFNEKVVSYTSDFLKLSTFGYSRAASSLLWLRFLQHTPPERVDPGQVSWMYYDLDAVTDLDPDFLPAYTHGGIFLSVITEDKKGAEEILLKGSRRFPENWRLHAYLAYHYQFELQMPDKADERYLMAANAPDSPDLIKILASNTVAKRSGVNQAIEMLRGLLEETTNFDSRERIQDKIRKLEKARDG